jgi:hypothetical protein
MFGHDNIYKKKSLEPVIQFSIYGFFLLFDSILRKHNKRLLGGRSINIEMLVKCNDMVDGQIIG